ncbi:MAG: carbohydrate ABC transporter permease, partial [Treponema sp.]|nr:carbohydrate ABC transporter permease [Treponema sp.]
MVRQIKEKLIKIVLVYIPVCLFSVFVLLPLFWAFSTSLKSEQEIMSSSARFIPQNITFNSYRRIWEIGRFASYFLNSLYISIISVLFITTLAVMNGYALSRYKFRGKKVFMLMLLGTQLLPIIILLIPLFIIFSKIKIINTRWSLIVLYMVIQTPFNSLLMKGFMDNIPIQIDEAAMVDGANKFQLITRIILPVIIPGIVATTAFAFIGCWNEFLAAFSFISSRQL